MALYHCEFSYHSRGKGHSAVAAAAYRAGVKLHDERTGITHDYTRKTGVIESEIVLPEHAPDWAHDREKLWNAVEDSETRRDARLGRDIEVSLPAELTHEQRRALALDFARELVDRHGFAVDVSFHKPSSKGDQRNYHAHIYCSTRRLRANGFDDKTRELDDKARGPKEIEAWRKRWAELQNDRLHTLGHAARVDHRTLKAQGIEREPTKHRGKCITAIDRRNEPSHTLERWSQAQNPKERYADEQEVEARLGLSAYIAQLQEEKRRFHASIVTLSQDIAAATRARDELVRERDRLKANTATEKTPMREQEPQSIVVADAYRVRPALDRSEGLELEPTPDKKPPDDPPDAPGDRKGVGAALAAAAGEQTKDADLDPAERERQKALLAAQARDEGKQAGKEYQAERERLKIALATQAKARGHEALKQHRAEEQQKAEEKKANERAKTKDRSRDGPDYER